MSSLTLPDNDRAWRTRAYRPAGAAAGEPYPVNRLAALDRRVAACLPALGAPRPRSLCRIAQMALARIRQGEGHAEGHRHSIARLGRTLLAGRPGIEDISAALATAAAGGRHDERDLAAAAGLLLGSLVLADAGTIGGPGIILAATAAALAGLRVQLLCPDATQVAQRMSHLKEAATRLGFAAAEVTPVMAEGARRRAYCADVICSTVEQVCLDHLCDLRANARTSALNRLALRRLNEAGSGDHDPVLAGVHLCLVDGAEQILAEKAVQPVGLQVACPAYDEFKMAAEAIVLADDLVAGTDFEVTPEGRIALTEAGEVQLSAAAERLQGVWSSQRWRCSAVCRAREVKQRWDLGHHYRFEGGRLEVLDPELARGLNEDRGMPSVRSLICAANGQLPIGSLVAQILACRLLTRYPRLSALGMGGSTLAREVRLRYGMPAVRLAGRSAIAPPLDHCRIYASARGRAACVLQDARNAERCGATVAVVTNDQAIRDALVDRASLQEETDCDQESLCLISAKKGWERQLSRVAEKGDSSIYVIVADASACLTFSEEAAAQRLAGRKVSYSACLKRQELSPQFMLPLTGACAYLLAGIAPRTAGWLARFALAKVAAQRRRIMMRHRSKIISRSQSARRALAFVQDAGT